MPYPDEIDYISTGEPNLPLAYPEPLNHLYGAHNRIVTSIRAIEVALGLNPPMTLAELAAAFGAFGPSIAALEATMAQLSGMATAAFEDMGNLDERAYLLELRLDQLEQAGPPPPTITSVLPSSVAGSGMAQLTITGADFVAPVTVHVGVNPVSANNTTLVSSSVITA